MTVRIVDERGLLVIDIRTRGPDGQPIRERRAAPDGISSKSGAKRWGEARQHELAKNGRQPLEAPKPDAPTFDAFADRWTLDYVEAEGLKPSTAASYERNLRKHLRPTLGALRLTEIDAAAVQRTKRAISALAPKTRACVLTLLAQVLGAAVEWKVLGEAPKVEVPDWSDPAMDFYDFATYARLVEGAAKVGPEAYAAILAAGDAGLRRGELVALEQTDVGPGGVTVARNEWQGKVGTPKGGRIRVVPLTTRLREALRAIRHMRGARVFFDGERAATVATFQRWMGSACRRAGLPESKNIHKLRHTFCSHLAMRGASPKAIQELAGHSEMTTTMRYMHLTSGATDAAIRLLESGASGGAGGERTC